MASYQELVNQAREKYGDAAVNEAIRSIEETSSGSKFSPQLEGINNRDYYSALSLLESDPNINQAVQAGYQARQQAKGAGMNVGQYQEYMAIREKQLGMPAPYGVTEISKGVIAPNQPISQTDLSNMQKQGFNPVYDQGIITGFEDTQRGMSIPLANINQYIEQTNQPIQQPNNQQIQPKESFQEVITPKGEFAGLKQIQPQYPNMIREPTTYQKIQSYIQKKTGIYLPSFGEAKLGTQNLMQQTYQEVQPLSTQGLPYRTAVGLLKPFEKAEYIVQQGFKDMGTTEYNTPIYLPKESFTKSGRGTVMEDYGTNKDLIGYKPEKITENLLTTENTYYLPYQTRGTAYYNPETKTYLPYTQGDQFTKVSTPLGAVGEVVAFAPRVSAMAFFPEVYFGASAIKNVGEKNYIGAGLDIGFGYGGRIVKPIVKSKIFQKFTDPLKSELIITERIRKYPEIEQLNIISPPKEIGKKLYSDVKSVYRPEAISKQTQVTLQTPIRKLFGLKPKTIYAGDPFLNKEAYRKAKSLLGDFGIEKESAKQTLRQTRPKIQEYRFAGRAKLLDEDAILVGASKISPSKLKGARQFKDYGEVIVSPSKQIRQIEDKGYVFSLEKAQPIKYTKDGAMYSELRTTRPMTKEIRQNGMTFKIEKIVRERKGLSLSQVTPTERIDLGKLSIGQDFLDSRFFKTKTLSREFTPMGRLRPIEKSTSRTILKGTEPEQRQIINLPETRQISQKQIEKIVSQIPKPPKSQMLQKSRDLILKPKEIGITNIGKVISSQKQKQEYIQAPILKSEFRTIEISKQKPIERVKLESKIRLEQKEDLRLSSATVTSQIDKSLEITKPTEAQKEQTKQREAQLTRTLPKQDQLQKQKQELKLLPKAITIPQTIQPQRPRPETPIVPRPKILPFAKSVTSKLGKGIKIRRTGLLTIEFRRKGKFTPIAKVSDIGSALAIGKSKSRGTLGASFRVKSDKGYLSFKPSEEFGLGSKGRDSTILVQRATSRLSSRPERLEIIRSRGRFL